MAVDGALRNLFHPAIVAWMENSFESPTPPQLGAWPAIAQGKSVLVSAPTGSGKTLCAFLSSINQLILDGETAALPDETRVLYVSPLKALSNDIEKNLALPLSGICAYIKEKTSLGITTAVRTGDTPAYERSKQLKKPAHIYVTTPETFYLLLTSERGRELLGTVRTVIIDEVHALVRDKRGSHLALSLERLDLLLSSRGRSAAQRIGLSATQKPIERVAEFLVGADTSGMQRPCTIVDTGHRRKLDLSLCLPDSPLEAVMSAECWTEIYDKLASLVRQHRTTLIFTNTRRLAERITRFLAERLGDEAVTSHHGSLARNRRHAAERALKEGRLKALVATASLELGIDVGEVELVCQISSPGSIATLLQRVGRSGHSVSGTPKGRLFPLSRDDLVESLALLDAVKRGELDAVQIPEAPLDILAQQIVATVVPGELGESELLCLVRGAWPYRNLSLGSFERVLAMLANGYSTSRGRRGAYLHHDAIGKRVKARRSARIAALTNGGAIPDNFDFEVVLQPSEIKVGTVHEDFAIESIPGDIFQLGNASYQILKIDSGILRVSDAQGLPPTIPFWIAEAPSRTDELSFSVSRFRQSVDEAFLSESLSQLSESLALKLDLSKDAVRQACDYLVATQIALGHMPTQKRIIAERFFDEAGGMHVVIHATFGSRFNRAFGLALRKRFCRSFNVELQAAAGEDALILSLGPMHSFPLASVFEFLKKNTVRTVLTQALLDAPLFQTRWRWNATRALAILRFRGGKKVPPKFQRIDSDDLLALCFPDQVACLENIAGDRDVPEHPLVQQSVVDCLTEAMDVVALERVLGQIECGEVELVARDLTEASPLAHEILNARPYAFLDDAPLEERRTHAVSQRRFADPQSATDLGALNPTAIEQVVREAAPEPRDADELHDALLVHCFLPPARIAEPDWIAQLAQAGRAYRIGSGKKAYWVAAERVHIALAIHPQAQCSPNEPTPRERIPTFEVGLVEALRGQLEYLGPTTVSEIEEFFDVSKESVSRALLTLESEGFVLRGRFRSESSEEFCERRLLARIHRLTLRQLRREIEPISPTQYVDFLTHHQGLQPTTIREGDLGLLSVLEQLAGFPVAAGSWESDLLPARIRNYSPSSLDRLCLSGQVTWAAARRASRSSSPAKNSMGPLRSTPIVIVPREELEVWLSQQTQEDLNADAKRLALILGQQGAMFFEEARRSAHLLDSQAEKALAELIARGLVTTDSFAGLRTLLTPSNKRRPVRRAHRRGPRSSAPTGMSQAGRISLIERDKSEELDGELEEIQAQEEQIEGIAWALLSRWGVVFRKVLERERSLPPWGELMRIYHRLEARGEIRGGRFISQFSGEQFATPEAVQALRQLRKDGPTQELLRIAGTDPLNVRGILTPESRISATGNNRLLLLGGQFVAIAEGNDLEVFPPQQDDNLLPSLPPQNQLRSMLRGPYRRLGS